MAARAREPWERGLRVPERATEEEVEAWRVEPSTEW